MKSPSEANGFLTMIRTHKWIICWYIIIYTYRHIMIVTSQHQSMGWGCSIWQKLESHWDRWIKYDGMMRWCDFLRPFWPTTTRTARRSRFMLGNMGFTRCAKSFRGICQIWDILQLGWYDNILPVSASGVVVTPCNLNESLEIIFRYHARFHRQRCKVSIDILMVVLLFMFIPSTAFRFFLALNSSDLLIVRCFKIVLWFPMQSWWYWCLVDPDAGPSFRLPAAFHRLCCGSWLIPTC